MRVLSTNQYNHYTTTQNAFGFHSQIALKVLYTSSLDYYQSLFILYLFTTGALLVALLNVVVGAVLHNTTPTRHLASRFDTNGDWVL
jgi:hypothetical protein